VPSAPDRALRRAAGRVAISGKRPPDSLVAAAHAGILNRDNTKKGTRGRQAVYLAESGRRRLAHPFESARKALGHEPSAERAATTIGAPVGDPAHGTPARFVELSGLSRQERSRIGRYGSLVGQLRDGQITPAAFRRRVSRWAPVAGLPLLSDPDAVLAIVERRRAAGEPSFVYRNGQAPGGVSASSAVAA
jgi:hypothetical protein